MGFCEFIEKSLSRNRGYKYHTYQTEISGNFFKLYHYGTKILEVDLDKKKVLDYFIYSKSDADAISLALWKIGLKNYFIHRYSLYKEVKFKNLEFYIRVRELEQLDKVKKFFSEFDKETLQKINELGFDSKIKLVEKIISDEIDERYVFTIIKLSESMKKAFEKREEKISKDIIVLNNAILVNQYPLCFILPFLSNKIYQTFFSKIKIRKNYVFFNKKHTEIVEEIEDENLKKAIDMHPLKEEIINNLIINNI